MLKALVEIITPEKRTSFLIRKFDKKGFLAPFHFHPEYELTCILEGKGKRFVGNNMSGFQNNDLVLMGSNLPHCWKLTPSKNEKAGSIVIQFNPGFLGTVFFETPEISDIQKLLKRSEGGIEFSGKIKEQVRKSMLDVLVEKNNFKKLIALLEILNKLSVSKEYILLNKECSVCSQTENNRARINKVQAYIVDNFHNEISLNKAAQIIGMTPNAFCKYFKKVTRKTFMETVINYRINFAMQLLTETDKSIADVCSESGFGDISNFYKLFTSKMETSPLNYRKQFLQETNL
jgi:AraC-like DNA-binding protein